MDRLKHALPSAAVVLLLSGLALAPSAYADKQDEQDRVSIRGTDKHLHDFVRMAAKQAGLKHEVMDGLGGTCSVNFDDLTLGQAMDSLTRLYDARWYVRDGVLHVVTEEVFLNQNPEAADRPGTKQEEQAPEARADKKKGDKTDPAEGTMEIHVKDLSVPKIFQLLHIQSSKNIMHTDQVSGKISLDLKDVTFDQVMAHILETNGWRHIDLDHCIWVVTQDEWDTHQKERDQDEKDQP